MTHRSKMVTLGETVYFALVIKYSDKIKKPINFNLYLGFEDTSFIICSMS